MVDACPTVSVIIPTWNSEKTIQSCLRSVINQESKKLEIIVIDDCSRDNTVKIVRSFSSVRLILNQENKGPSYSRNIGIRQSVGEIIILLDSDSYLVDRKWVLRFTEAHMKNNRCIIGGGIQGVGKGLIAKAEKYFWVTNIPASSSKIPYGYSHFVANNMSFCRNVFDEIGGFDESLCSGEDIIFCKEAVKKGISLILCSNIIAYHRDRETISEVVSRGLRYGKDRLALKRKGAYKYGFLLPSNPFLCFLLSPIITLLIVIRFVIGWIYWDKKVLIYSPIIYFANYFIVIGVVVATLMKRYDIKQFISRARFID